LIYLSLFYLAHNTIVNDVFKRPLLVPACRARLFRSVGQRTWLSDSDKILWGCRAQKISSPLGRAGLLRGGALASGFAGSFVDKSFFGEFIDKTIVHSLWCERFRIHAFDGLKLQHCADRARIDSRIMIVNLTAILYISSRKAGSSRLRYLARTFSAVSRSWFDAFDIGLEQPLSGLAVFLQKFRRGGEDVHSERNFEVGRIH
jgi:hypothetical protein